MGEELGRRVKMQKTDVSFDVIYFFKQKYHKRVYIYIFQKTQITSKRSFFF